jgi:ribose transport system substrate-binding protein
MRPALPTRRDALAWLGLLALGCGGEGPTPPAGVGGSGSKRAIKLGAALPMFSHPFFVAQRRGMEEEAGRLGVALDVRDGQDDDQKQIVQVEALINLGCDAIVLCPRDENALAAAVESANRAGVPVVTMNRRVNGGRVVTYVGADDAEGGEAQARALRSALGAEGGKIIYLQGTPGSSPQVSRNKGLHRALDNHPEVEIAADAFTNFQEDKAKSVMAGLVRRFRPGEIRALVAQADELALPAAEVARAEGWKDLLVIGFNGTREAFEAIRAGTMLATVLQDPAEQGQKAVRAAIAFLKGQDVPPEVITDLPLITRSTLDQFSPAY